MNSKLASSVSTAFSNTGTYLLGLVSDLLAGLIKGTVKGVFHITSDLVGQLITAARPYLESSVLLMQFLSLVSSLFDLLTELFNPIVTLIDGNYKPLCTLSIVRRMTVFISQLCVAFAGKLNQVYNDVFFDATAESNDTAILNFFVAYFMPPSLRSILKDVSTLSNFKIMDDCTLIFDFISFILNIPKRFIVLFLTPSDFTSKLINFFDSFALLFPVGFHGKTFQLSRDIVTRYQRDNRLAHSAEFQDEFNSIFTDFKRYIESLLLTRKDLPPMCHALNKSMTSIKAKIDYILSNIRQEPIMVVFYGPAGSGKTTSMNSLINAYSKTNTVYIHSSPTEGKDFYDQYDNEFCYAADDVGQISSTQWSPYINMVSTTKYPLNCAAVEKKDTKFFTSRLILLTTNNINITITPTCGISELAALHRRMQLVDFSSVKFNDGVMTGHVEISLYNLTAKRFIVQKTIQCDIGYDNLIREIDTYIREKLRARMALAEIQSKPIELEALPESGSSIFHDLCSDTLWLLERGFESLINSLFSIGSFASEHLFLIFTFILIIFYFLYNAPQFFKRIDSRQEQLSTVLPFLPQSEKMVKSITALPESLNKIFELPRCPPNSALTRLALQTYGVEANYVNLEGVQVTTQFISIFSGKFFTGPYHGCLTNSVDDIYITVFSTNLNIVYDHVRVKRVWYNDSDDIAIYELPMFLPKYFKNLSFTKLTSQKKLACITPNNQIDINEGIKAINGSIRYFKGTYVNTIQPEDYRAYDLHTPALCGSFIVTTDNFLIGHHVAYSQELGKGIFRIFSQNTSEVILDYFSQKVDYLVSLHRTEKKTGSVAYLDSRKTHMPSCKNSIVSSDVRGIFDEERIPVTFGPDPIKTLKTLSKEAFMPSETADIKLLKQTANYLDSLFTGYNYQMLDQSAVISGKSAAGEYFLNRIDPATSVGFGLTGDKRSYIDYERLAYTDELSAMIMKFESQVLSGEYPDFFFVENLKDELRDVEKASKPRIVKGSPLVHTILGRKYLGHFLSYLHKNRNRLGIQVGINPFSKDWGELLSSVVKHGDNVFDGDFGKYDKKMLSMFQQMVNDCIIKACAGATPEQTKMIRFLLQSICNTPTISVTDVFITTHSLPSGSFCTAEYNSIVQKAYMFYVFSSIYYKRFSCYPTIMEYINNVSHHAYGDDGLTGVSPSAKLYFNGPAVSDEFALLGLEYTPGDKADWNYNTRSIYECTFLKRAFKFHRGLSMIVAPLQAKTMKSTLNYVKDDYRNSELTNIKLQNFQRECFLHETDYDYLLGHIMDYTHNVSFDFQPLSRDYLVQLYLDEKFIEYYSLSKAI